MILLIETSHKLCSVAVCDKQGHFVFIQTDTQNLKHAESLPPMVQEAVNKHKIQAVAISQGPGSYTGLRIGSSMAQGLSYALNIPLIAVPTHLAIGWQACLQLNVQHVICLLYAGRNEAYTTTIKANQLQNPTITNQIYDPTHLLKLDALQHFAGDCPQLLPNMNYAALEPHAMYLAPIAIAKLQQGIIEDPAYFTPMYAKDYIPGISTKNKI